MERLIRCVTEIPKRTHFNCLLVCKSGTSNQFFVDRFLLRCGAAFTSCPNFYQRSSLQSHVRGTVKLKTTIFLKAGVSEVIRVWHSFVSRKRCAEPKKDIERPRAATTVTAGVQPTRLRGLGSPFDSSYPCTSGDVFIHPPYPPSTRPSPPRDKVAIAPFSAQNAFRSIFATTSSYRMLFFMLCKPLRDRNL